MNPQLPDNQVLPFDEVMLAKVQAAYFFSKFKDDIAVFEAQNVEVFGIDKSHEIQAFQIAFRFELLSYMAVGLVMGMAVEHKKKTSVDNVKFVFNNWFERISQHLEIIYPDLKFVAYSMEKKDGDGKQANPPKGK